MTPVFMILEVIMEMIIPLLMASIIDDGVNAGNMNHIYKVGAYMVVAAIIGLWAGMMGAKYFQHNIFFLSQLVFDSFVYTLLFFTKILTNLIRNIKKSLYLFFCQIFSDL